MDANENKMEKTCDDEVEELDLSYITKRIDLLRECELNSRLLKKMKQCHYEYSYDLNLRKFTRKSINDDVVDQRVYELENEKELLQKQLKELEKRLKVKYNKMYEESYAVTLNVAETLLKGFIKIALLRLLQQSDYKCNVYYDFISNGEIGMLFGTYTSNLFSENLINKCVNFYPKMKYLYEENCVKFTKRGIMFDLTNIITKKIIQETCFDYKNLYEPGILQIIVNYICLIK